MLDGVCSHRRLGDLHVLLERVHDASELGGALAQELGPIRQTAEGRRLGGAEVLEELVQQRLAGRVVCLNVFETGLLEQRTVFDLGVKDGELYLNHWFVLIAALKGSPPST